MNRPCRVILLIESSRAYGRGCLMGIGAYVRDQGPWQILHWERRISDRLPEVAMDWKCDGIISRIENRKLVHALDRLGVPVVDLRGTHPPRLGTTFDTDPEACARLAADHFLERGFRHFAFCGYPGLNFSDKRCECFVRRLNLFGHQPAVFVAASTRKRKQNTLAQEAYGEASESELAAWLQTLPRPLAVFACNDVRGRQVLSACTLAGLLVPEEVAVLGVDNDEVICSLALPPLSSIHPDTFRMGYEGAAALDAMMHGQRPDVSAHWVPPCEVVVRLSSDILAIDDPDLVAAVRFIREHACQGITTREILKNVPISRATLERRFQKVLGRTPKAEIERIRLERARHLLAETDYKLERIALMVGYQTAPQFAIAFKRHTGQTPGQYRLQRKTESIPFKGK